MRTFLRCRSKWDKLLLIGMLLLVLSPSMNAQAFIDSVCVLTDYPSATGKEHAIYLNALPNSLGKKFVFDSLGGQMTVFSDSTIRITGRVVHKVDPTWQWDINMWLFKQKDYATWDSLGRKVKRGAAPFNLFHASKVNFDLFELDSTKSFLSGTPGTFYDGDTLFLSHMPANLEYGFQRGIAANGQTGDYGMSGWFFFTGSYSGVGDINVNISCAPPICDVAIDTVIANCLTDSTFELAVTVSGDSAYNLADDQGLIALSGVSAGTYMMGPYANNTQVNVFANNANIYACADSAGPFTLDCTPPCEANIDSIAAVCVSDTTFEIVVTIGGTGTNYELIDDQGSAPMSGLSAGTYNLGPYPNNINVTVTVADLNLIACADTAAPLTLDCTPPPVCDLAIDSISTVCTSDTTFEVVVTILGTGTGYELDDNLGLFSLTGLSAGTYNLGPYANFDTVIVYANDANITACADTAGPVTADCTPPPVCDVSIDSISTVCLTDTTFEVIVNLSGTGTYDLTDNLGVDSLMGVNAGTHNLGPYTNNASVFVYANDINISACADTAGSITADCTPPITCDVNIDSIVTTCLTDSTYETSVTFSGTAPYYFISDNMGTGSIGVPGAGTYTYGSYSSDSAVTIFVRDSLDATCADTLGPIQALCACDVTIDTIFALCITPDSFEIVVEFSGIGTNYQIVDSEGNPALTGLTSGTYFLGPYFNSTDVFITVSDPNFASCFDFSGPYTADCTPVPLCDLVIDSVKTNCFPGGNTFELLVSLSGTASGTYKIYDDKGSPVLTGLSAGTHNFGVYSIGDTVQISAEDVNIFGCIKNFSETVTVDSCGVNKPGELVVGNFYPNPTLNKSKINVKMPEDGKLDWILLDSYGNQISNGFEMMYKGANFMEFKTSNLTPGLYILEVIHEGAIVASRKLIVIH